MKNPIKYITAILFFLSLSGIVSAITAVKQETVSSDYPGPLASLGDRVIKTTYNDGTITWEKEGSAFQKLALNELGGRIVYVSYGYTGRCGSGTSQQYSYYIDTPGDGSWGTMQISCTVPESEREAVLKAKALSYAKISPLDTVYLKGSLYQSPSGGVIGNPIPTPTATGTPGTTPTSPVIVPPQLSQLLSAIWSSIMSLFGL